MAEFFAEVLQLVESFSGECLAEVGHVLGLMLLFFAGHPLATVPAALISVGIQRIINGKSAG